MNELVRALIADLMKIESAIIIKSVNNKLVAVTEYKEIIILNNLSPLVTLPKNKIIFLFKEDVLALIDSLKYYFNHYNTTQLVPIEKGFSIYQLKDNVDPNTSTYYKKLIKITDVKLIRYKFLITGLLLFSKKWRELIKLLKSINYAQQ